MSKSFLKAIGTLFRSLSTCLSDAQVENHNPEQYKDVPDLDESGLERPTAKAQTTHAKHDRINIMRDDEN